MTRTEQVESTNDDKPGCCSSCGDFKDMQEMMERCDDNDCHGMMKKMCGKATLKDGKVDEQV